MTNFATAPIHIFARADDHPFGSSWIARFYPYDDFPVFFQGDSMTDVYDKADAWRKEQLKKAEVKKLSMRKAQAARHKK